MTIEEVEAIVRAEYRYWYDVDDPNLHQTSTGAMGACANILAAIVYDHRAPWHPGYEPEASL